VYLHGFIIRENNDNSTELISPFVSASLSTREIAQILGVCNQTVARDVTNVTPVDAVAALNQATISQGASESDAECITGAHYPLKSSNIGTSAIPRSQEASIVSIKSPFLQMNMIPSEMLTSFPALNARM